MRRDLISEIYDAAIGEGHWNDAVSGLAELAGADVLILGSGNPRALEPPELWTVNWNTEPLKTSGYEISDVWDPSVNPDIAAGLVMPLAKTVDRRLYVSEEAFSQSDFLQSSVVKQNLQNYRLFTPARSPDMLSGGFIAKHDAEDFEAESISRFDAILPHVSRALRLREQLQRHKSSESTLGEILDRLSYGVMLLDRSGRVVFMNALCETFVRRNDGLYVRGRRPVLDRSAQIILDAVLAGDGNISGPATMQEGIVIPRSSGMAPYLARIYPGVGFASMHGCASVRAAVLIDDLFADSALPDAGLLKAFFGLTPAEASVAQLVPSAPSRKEIADYLGLSENTVKTHLAAIRIKTGVQSTRELSQVIVRAAGGRFVT